MCELKIPLPDGWISELGCLWSRPPILLDLCLHPSIKAFCQDVSRRLLSIFKCSIAQKNSKIPATGFLPFFLVT